MTPRKPAAAKPAPEPDVEPAPLPEAEAVPPAPEQAELDAVAAVNAQADRARGRTAVQAIQPTMVMILVDYLCALQGWDLDPWSEGTGLPTTVSGALIGVGTWLAAVRMNPKIKAR